MHKAIVLTASLLVFISANSIGNAQDQSNKTGLKQNLFLHLSNNVVNNVINTDYYPNNTGDFWEYIVKDTTTLLDQLYVLNFSITREVLGDTLMTNGKTYKQIKWENIANSVDYLPWYEYQRIDSTGNVFIYYNNQEYLLFDFNLSIGETYPAHLPNHNWKISDKYNVIGFSDTVFATDLELYESETTLKEKYTVAEKFGIIYYVKNINEYAIPEGNFWGAVINGTTYGKMIVKKQTMDWKEFYPLHIGDFWKYSSASGSINSTISRKIIGDTVMSDLNTYSISETINYTFEDTAYNYSRVDSFGNIYSWESWSSSAKRSVKLGNIVGDTISNGKTSGFNWRIDNKSDSSVKYFVYPDWVYSSDWYTKGLGLTEWTIEGGGGFLLGAIINGAVYGDTTTVGINDEVELPTEFALYQNYPNPFNPGTKIKYSIPADVKDEMSKVILRVYDLLGREVATLVNEEKPVGNYEVEFNGSKLPSGVYIYTLRVNDFAISKKMLILK